MYQKKNNENIKKYDNAARQANFFLYLIHSLCENAKISRVKLKQLCKFIYYLNLCQIILINYVCIDKY